MGALGVALCRPPFSVIRQQTMPAARGVVFAKLRRNSQHAPATAICARRGVVIGSRYASFAEFSDRARYARITFLLGLTLILSCSADSTVVDMIVCGGIGIVVGVVRAGLRVPRAVEPRRRVEHDGAAADAGGELREEGREV